MYWQAKQKLDKAIEEQFGKDAWWSEFEGTYSGDKKIAGAGIDIEIPVGGFTITQERRQQAKDFVIQHVGALKNVTVTSHRWASGTTCICIKAREW